MDTFTINLRSVFFNQIAAILISQVEKFKITPKRASLIAEQLLNNFSDYTSNEKFITRLKKMKDLNINEITVYIDSFVSSYALGPLKSK